MLFAVMSMRKTALRVLALLLLSLLLVFAPQILTRVAPPYAPKQPRRVLLSVALCSQDAGADRQVLHLLNAFQKEHPQIHLRVRRLDPSALAEPLPDVFLCDMGQENALPERMLLPGIEQETFPLLLPDDLTLCFAIRRYTENVAAALALFSSLSGENP